MSRRKGEREYEGSEFILRTGCASMICITVSPHNTVSNRGMPQHIRRYLLNCFQRSRPQVTFVSPW